MQETASLLCLRDDLMCVFAIYNAKPGFCLLIVELFAWPEL